MLFYKLKPYIYHQVNRSDDKNFQKFTSEVSAPSWIWEKKREDSSETDRQLLHLSNDIDKLEKKVKQLENAIAMMDDEAFECMCLAKEKSDLSYVIKENGFKHKSEQSKASISTLSKEITEQEGKRKKSSK